MRVHLCSLLLILNFCGMGISQEVMVKGKILDQSNQTVPFATIVFTSIQDSQLVRGTLGDEEGGFSLSLEKHRYHLDVSLAGITTKRFAVDLTKSSRIENLGSFKITTEIQLKEVLVKGSRSTYKMELDKKTYQVSSDLLSSGGSLADVMENIPSVQIESDGSIRLRGMGEVNILINGQASGLTDFRALFRTIPANTIEKVEVISNPSSKYSSEGSGGIINVVLKKGKKNQLRSSLELFSGYRLNSGINLNFNKGNETTSWYLNTGLGYSEPKATNGLTLINPQNNLKLQDQSSERLIKQFYFLTNLGGQKKLNDFIKLTADITYRKANSNIPFSINYNDFQDGELFRSSERFDIETGYNHFFQSNLKFQFDLNQTGSKLDLNLNYHNTQEQEDSDILENHTYPLPSFLSHEQVIDVENSKGYVFSADYIHPLKNDAQLEMGLQNRNALTNDDFSAQRFINNEWILLSELSNERDFHENIWAFYAQYAKSIQKFQFQLGLRTEWTHMELINPKNDLGVKRQYHDLFPSAFLSYSFDEKNQLRWSFSRRIRRPRSLQLLPISSFSNNRNVFFGNPELRPSYNLISELDYQTRIAENWSISTSLFYRFTSDIVDFFIQKESLVVNTETEDFFVSRSVNIGNLASLGTEINVSFNPQSWIKMYGEIIANDFKQSGSYEGRHFNNRGLFFYGRINLDFKIGSSLKLQIQNRYRKGNINGQLERKGIYRMDAGFGIDLFKDKASLNFNYKDVFNTWKWRIIVQSEEFIQESFIQTRQPQLNASFTYILNQKEYTGKKGRQYDKQ